MDTPCFEKPAQADWSIVIVEPLSVVIPGVLANFSCVSGYWVVVSDVEVCKDRRTVISVNVIPWHARYSINIWQLLNVTALTADRNNGFLCNVLSVGVKGVENNDDQNVEQVDRGTLHNNADEDNKTERGRHYHNAL